MGQGAAEAVGVGVAGNDDVGVDFRGLSDGEGEDPGVFRVGDAPPDGGEVPVGNGLRFNQVEVPVAEFFQGRDNRSGAHAVKGRVEDADVPLPGEGEAGEFVVVGYIDFGVYDPDQSRFDCCVEIARFDGCDGLDLVHNVSVVGGYDLAPVRPVGLESVVGGRVVAGADDHAGHGAGFAHGKGEFRCGAEAVEEVGKNAVARQDGGGLPGKAVGVVPGVVGDHSAPAGAIGPSGFQDVPGQALGSFSDGAEVDPVGTGAHFAADAARAKLDLFSEGILEFNQVLIFDQVEDFRPEIGIGRLHQPVHHPGCRLLRELAFLYPDLNLLYPRL